MMIRPILFAGTLLFAAPVLAQAPDTSAALNSSNNWAAFMKFYPARAIAAREEGSVGFTVTLDSKGEVTGCQVTRSSGHQLLDQETCQLISLHAQFKPDAGLSSSQVRTSNGLITWKLPASSSSVAAANSIQHGSAPEKVVCKRTLRTGSLADFDRTCMTPSQWAKQSEEQKSYWEDLQGKKGSSNGN